MTDDIEFESRMSDADALMWSIEKNPLLRSTITSISVLDRAPDRQQFRRRMDRATRVIPRLRQRVLGHPYSIAPPRWEIDPNFDLDFHLRWVRAAGRGSLREVLDMAGPIAMQGFDRARPLWEFVVVEGLEGDRSAIIQKVHHAITDGVGGVELQLEMLDLEREPTEDPDEEMPEAPTPTTPGEMARMADAVAYESRRQLGHVRNAVASAGDGLRGGVRDPVGVVTHAIEMAASAARMLRPTTEPLSPLMTDRSLSVRFDTITLDLNRMKAAGKVVSGKLNDAFVAGVSGGLRRYHESHGTQADQLRMTMPINIRDSATHNQSGNHFVPARFTVPVGISDPIALMTAVRELVEFERNEPALSLTEPIAGILNRMPTGATTALFGSMLKGVDFVTSNVPGAPFPVYLAGAKVETQFAFGPMTGAAMNIVLLSYMDDLNIGVNTDPAAVPDPDVLVTCLEESFAELDKLG
jgi:diacylglycerol O-acyltransferase